jgi:hypothetical protein
MDWFRKPTTPTRAKIKLVQDNYSTHSYGAFFYEHLPLDTARDLRHRSNFHYTSAPWLNMVEIGAPALPASAWTAARTQQRLEEEALTASQPAAATESELPPRSSTKNRYEELTKMSQN